MQARRRRVWIFGVSLEYGGGKAADWMLETIESIFEYRRINPPTPLFDVIGETAADKRRRAAAGTKEGVCVVCVYAYISMFSVGQLYL
jgi:hypothetical protein